jgi:type VI protein secretion system component Hcp
MDSKPEIKKPEEINDAPMPEEQLENVVGGDNATPKLHEAACKGTHIPEVTVELWRSGGDKPIK